MVQTTRRLGIAEKVSFMGRVDQPDLPMYYGAADLLVMPSYSESFGMVGLEALACGRPVVTTPVGAVDSLVRKAQAGCVVPDHSSRSLAAGIQATIRNHSLPTADQIHQSIRDYSWSNVAAAVIAEYERAIKLQFFKEAQQGMIRPSTGSSTNRKQVA